jgi:uncharacterized membrane protein
MEVCMMETNIFNHNGEQTISCPVKKLNKYTCMLVFYVAFFSLVAVSIAWAADITYPVSTFNDGKARFYEYKTSDGIVIKYFILKSSDGVIRAAFDACDVCWEAGKGYQQKDEFMVCKNCGRRFHSTKVNEVSGGCNPAPLIRKIQDGKVVIDTQNIITGKRYFDFKGKRG